MMYLVIYSCEKLNLKQLLYSTAIKPYIYDIQSRNYNYTLYVFKSLNFISYMDQYQHAKLIIHGLMQIHTTI